MMSFRRINLDDRSMLPRVVTTVDYSDTVRCNFQVSQADDGRYVVCDSD